jgi:hypothetical protein
MKILCRNLKKVAHAAQGSSVNRACALESSKEIRGVDYK